MLMQQVTIGQLAGSSVPILGSFVYVGAGAKLLGGIRIGDRARIGANAVVLCDVPEDRTAVGVPARIVPSDVRKHERGLLSLAEARKDER
jgi:serine O-acetyltransferase